MARTIGEMVSETALRLWILDLTVKSGQPLREARKLAYQMLDKICEDLLKEEADGEN